MSCHDLLLTQPFGYGQVYLSLSKGGGLADHISVAPDRRRVDRIITEWAIEKAFALSDQEAVERYETYIQQVRSLLQGAELLPVENPFVFTLKFLMGVQSVVQRISNPQKKYAIVLYGSVVNGRSHKGSDLDYAIFEKSKYSTQSWAPSIKNPVDLLTEIVPATLGFNLSMTAPIDDPPHLIDLRNWIVKHSSTMIMVTADAMIWSTPKGDLILNSKD